jgi:hypothetical protein
LQRCRIFRSKDGGMGRCLKHRVGRGHGSGRLIIAIWIIPATLGQGNNTAEQCKSGGAADFHYRDRLNCPKIGSFGQDSKMPFLIRREEMRSGNPTGCRLTMIWPCY